MPKKPVATVGAKREDLSISLPAAKPRGGFALNQKAQTFRRRGTRRMGTRGALDRAAKADY